MNRSRHAPFQVIGMTQASFTWQCMSLTKRQPLVTKENMVTKATEAVLKNWTVVMVHVYSRKSVMLFGEFMFKPIHNLVTSSADSTSVNCSSRNFPPWASLMWFSSGPVDSLVNRHKWYPRITLRWQRVWVMVEVLFCDLWLQNRQM